MEWDTVLFGSSILGLGFTFTFPSFHSVAPSARTVAATIYARPWNRIRSAPENPEARGDWLCTDDT